MFERYSDRARRLILMALWSARRRGGAYIEPEDLLHAIIREDRGDFAALSAEPGITTRAGRSQPRTLELIEADDPKRSHRAIHL